MVIEEASINEETLFSKEEKGSERQNQEIESHRETTGDAGIESNTWDS